MMKVEVKDTVLWFKGIHGDTAFLSRLERLRAGEIVRLRVDGNVGEWKKMQDNRTTGRPTPGLAPIGPAALRWRDLYRANKASGGILVNIEAVSSAESGSSTVPRDWDEAGEVERQAAWEAFKALRNAGWSSEGRKVTREQLHEGDGS